MLLQRMDEVVEHTALDMDWVQAQPLGIRKKLDGVDRPCSEVQEPCPEVAHKASDVDGDEAVDHILDDEDAAAHKGRH